MHDVDDVEISTLLNKLVRFCLQLYNKNLLFVDLNFRPVNLKCANQTILLFNILVCKLKTREINKFEWPLMKLDTANTSLKHF